MIEIIRLLIAVLGSGIAAYYDAYNKKNVPEIFLYGFLAVSLLTNVFDYTYFIKFLPIMLPLIAILYILYRMGQVGGADVIVLAAIYAAIPVFPFVEDQFVPSSLMVLAIGTVLASIYMIAKYVPAMWKKTIKGEIKFTVWQIFQVIILLFSFLMLIYIYYIFPIAPLWILIVSGILFFESIFFIIYKDEISKQMVVWKKTIEPEDVIVVELIDKKLVEKYKIQRLTDENQSRKLNKLKRKWPVFDLPMFLPFIFVGLIIYILLGII